MSSVKKKLTNFYNELKNDSGRTEGGQIEECDIFERFSSTKEKRIAVLIPKESWMGINGTPTDDCI